MGFPSEVTVLPRSPPGLRKMCAPRCHPVVWLLPGVPRVSPVMQVAPGCPRQIAQGNGGGS